MGRYGLAFLALSFALPASAGEPELGPPVRLEAAGKPIDVTGGFAAPLVVDLDGDGRRDLVVGQFHGDPKVRPYLFKARARVYTNRGTDVKPVFDDFEYFRAEDESGWTSSG